MCPKGFTSFLHLVVLLSKLKSLLCWTAWKIETHDHKRKQTKTATDAQPWYNPCMAYFRKRKDKKKFISSSVQAEEKITHIYVRWHMACSRNVYMNNGTLPRQTPVTKDWHQILLGVGGGGNERERRSKNESNEISLSYSVLLFCCLGKVLLQH